MRSNMRHGYASQRNFPIFFLKVTWRKMVYDNPRTQMQLLAFMCWARDAAWPSKTTCQCASLANPWPNLRSSWRTLRFVLEELHPGVLTLNSIINTLESPPLILHSTQKKPTTYKETLTHTRLAFECLGRSLTFDIQSL